MIAVRVYTRSGKLVLVTVAGAMWLHRLLMVLDSPVCAARKPWREARPLTWMCDSASLKQQAHYTRCSVDKGEELYLLRRCDPSHQAPLMLACNCFVRGNWHETPAVYCKHIVSPPDEFREVWYLVRA